MEAIQTPAFSKIITNRLRHLQFGLMKCQKLPVMEAMLPLQVTCSTAVIASKNLIWTSQAGNFSPFPFDFVFYHLQKELGSVVFVTFLQVL